MRIITSGLLAGVMVLYAFECPAFSRLMSDTGVYVQWNDTTAEAVPYYINEDGTSQDLCGDDEFSVFQAGFSAWTSDVPTTRAGADYLGTTTIDDYSNDDSNVLLFVSGDPDVSGSTLASTFYMYRVSTGEMIEVDIAFNDDVSWTTDPGTCGGDDVYDLRGVATHEIGHLFGMDHSLVGNYGGEWDASYLATMFPYYFGTQEMTLEPDDVAGITEIYPAPAPLGLGIIEGHIFTGDEGMFGVHMVALSETGKVPLVSGISAKDGSYRIFGVPAGGYYVLAESPEISGRFYTSFLSSPGYYSGADRLSNPWLYRDIEVEDSSSLEEGSGIFSVAEVVDVSADSTVAGIDFFLPEPPEEELEEIELSYDYDSSDSYGCGSLFSGRESYTSSASGSLPLLFMFAGLLVFRFLHARRTRRRGEIE